MRNFGNGELCWSEEEDEEDLDPSIGRECLVEARGKVGVGGVQGFEERARGIWN